MTPHAAPGGTPDAAPDGTPGAKPEADPCADLMARFGAAVTAKLQEAQRKHGFDNAWREPDWMDDCRFQLREHVEKGDPRDVAAYSAFLWHHGERTVPPDDDGAAHARFAAEAVAARRLRRALDHADATGAPLADALAAHGVSAAELRAVLGDRGHFAPQRPKRRPARDGAPRD